MDWHGLLDETPRAGCGLPPHELLVGEDSDISETTRAIALDLGCPPELNAKTPLLKTKHILWWGRKLRLQQTWNSPPCRLVWWHQWSPPALDSECPEMYLPGKMWLRCNSGLKVVGVGNHFWLDSRPAHRKEFRTGTINLVKSQRLGRSEEPGRNLLLLFH